MKDRKNSKNSVSAAVFVGILAVFTAACCAFLAMGKLKPEVASDFKDALEFLYVDESTTQAPSTNDEDYDTLRFMCAGDNLIYNAMYSQAKVGEGYDFSSLYASVKGMISSADIAAVTQGSVLSDRIAPSSYPYFSSPTAVADALIATGFSVFNQAERNVWAQGANGAQDTVSYWKTQTEAVMTGLYESEEAINDIPVMEKNGITLSFIGITQNTASPKPTDPGAYVINLADKTRSQTEIYNEIKAMIKAAKEKSDAVVVFVCFENKETKEPTEKQKKIVNYLVSFGADIIIGTGTNTVQPVELIDKGGNEYAAVAYSLGNFVSAQNAKENMLGGIADIMITKDKESGKTVIGSIDIIPTVTMLESGNTNVRILTLDAFKETTVTHGINGLNAEFAESYYDEVVGENTEKTLKSRSEAVKAAIEKRIKDEEKLSVGQSDTESGAQQ